MDHDRLLFAHASRQSYFPHFWRLSANSWKTVIFLANKIGHSHPLRVDTSVSCLVLFWYGGISCCALPGLACTSYSLEKQDCSALLNEWNFFTYKFAINNTKHVNPSFIIISLDFVRNCTLYCWWKKYFIVWVKMFGLRNFKKACNLRKNLKFRRVRATIVAVKKQ